MELRRYTWEHELVCVVLLISPVLVVGQTGTVQGTRGRPDPIQNELRRRFELEAIERVLAEGPRRGVSDRDVLLTQIREDFLRIQIVNDEIQKSIIANQLDPKLIEKSAAVIARCARRVHGMARWEATGPTYKAKVVNWIAEKLGLPATMSGRRR